MSPIAGTKARRVVELLVYLAAHDGTATRGEWLTAVSPEKTFSDGYVRNLVLLTRRSLEAITGDGDLLAYDRTTQRFTLAERVRSDWTILRSFAAGGEPDGLRAALSLVRGMPFGANPEPWTSAAGISYAIVAEVVDAAVPSPNTPCPSARRSSPPGPPAKANWPTATTRASGASSCEQLATTRHARGSGRSWATCSPSTATPSTDLDPATVDLYRVLSTPKPASADVVVLQDDDDVVFPTCQAV